jgi:hypothetical protein
MSHASGAVRFKDGVVKFYEYNGTSDVCISHLYDSMKAMLAHWRKGQWMACACPEGMEDVEIYSSYGGGFTFPGKACRKCSALYGGSYDEENYYDKQMSGEPQWHRDLPPTLMESGL